jgi:curved DNA-binding protein CbpA
VTPGSPDFWQRVARAVEQLDTRSYYELLGLEEDADVVAVQNAYAQLLRLFHPDRYATEPDPERQRDVSRLFARITEAHHVLSRTHLRAAYGEARRRGELRLGAESQEGRRPARESIPPMNEKTQRLLQRGREFLASGDLAAARAQLELASQFEPTARPVVEALADLAAREAERASGPASPQKPEPPSTPSPPSEEEQRVAAMSALLFDGEDALPEEPPALFSAESTPISPVITLLDQARSDMHDGRFTDAIRTLESALRVAPDDRQLKIEYHAACARHAQQIGDPSQARRHFEAVLRFDPRHPEALIALRKP